MDRRCKYCCRRGTEEQVLANMMIQQYQGGRELEAEGTLR